MQKLTLNPPKQTEGQSVQGTKDQACCLSRRFRGFENRIAREHLADNTPPEQAFDGFRKDVPAAVAPAHVDRAKHTVLVPNVEDVGAAVVQENTVFTILLLLHQGEHFHQSGFGFLLATQCGNDATII
jgi:hypothetical protein